MMEIVKPDMPLSRGGAHNRSSDTPKRRQTDRRGITMASQQHNRDTSTPSLRNKSL